MGKATGVCVARAPWLHFFVWMLVLVSMASSEGVNQGTNDILPQILETPPGFQLQRHAHGQVRGPSSLHLHASDVPTGVLYEIKGALADILMYPAKVISAVDMACSYTVTIKTSCSSPPFTRDAISLSFGDDYGNQVYAARLDDPSAGTFAQCSTDKFEVQGPCGNKTCYLYLRRSGDDGWAPDWVKIAPSGWETAQEVTFNYNASRLPSDVWYGFNLCSGDSGGGGRDSGAKDAHGMPPRLLASWTVPVLVLLVLQPRFFGRNLY